ncbi:MAG TPA: squalene/phytoene synthase family protein [Solirubrobacteraceae bacterium]|jgi:phytoene synthase|nr:squalene/phytoene synthase family protein [Solirubrobacteraceae bacterium]
MSAARSLDGAYRHCEAITRAQAANFYYGIRLLPRERRRAMCAVYAFARRIDDIGDGTLTPEQKLAGLDQALVMLGDDAQADPVASALADARYRFALPLDALSELVEGVRMDVNGESYEDFEQLLVYCRRVAGGIGRLCLAVFGLRTDAAGQEQRAQVLADELGVALQLTNILRDVREDALGGRVYLPAEDLRRFGIPLGEPTAPAGTTAPATLLAALEDEAQREQLAALVRFEAERARQWFDRGLELTELLDRRSAACVQAMAGIYRRLLERIDSHPEEAARRRLSLPAHEKALVAARGLLPLRGVRGGGV